MIKKVLNTPTLFIFIMTSEEGMFYNKRMAIIGCVERIHKEFEDLYDESFKDFRKARKQRTRLCKL